MNEKIKELWDKAVTLVEQEPDGDWSLDTIKDKFAELIVQECVDICNQATEQNNQTYAMLKEDELAEKMVIHGSINQAQKLGKGIKEHFGVEE